MEVSEDTLEQGNRETADQSSATDAQTHSPMAEADPADAETEVSERPDEPEEHLADNPDSSEVVVENADASETVDGPYDDATGPTEYEYEADDGSGENADQPDSAGHSEAEDAPVDTLDEEPANDVVAPASETGSETGGDSGVDSSRKRSRSPGGGSSDEEEDGGRRRRRHSKFTSERKADTPEMPTRAAPHQRFRGPAGSQPMRAPMNLNPPGFVPSAPAAAAGGPMNLNPPGAPLPPARPLLPTPPMRMLPGHRGGVPAPPIPARPAGPRPVPVVIPPPGRVARPPSPAAAAGGVPAAPVRRVSVPAQPPMAPSAQFRPPTAFPGRVPMPAPAPTRATPTTRPVIVVPAPGRQIPSPAGRGGPVVVHLAPKPVAPSPVPARPVAAPAVHRRAVPKAPPQVYINPKFVGRLPGRPPGPPQARPPPPPQPPQQQPLRHAMSPGAGVLYQPLNPAAGAMGWAPNGLPVAVPVGVARLYAADPNAAYLASFAEAQRAQLAAQAESRRLGVGGASSGRPRTIVVSDLSPAAYGNIAHLRSTFSAVGPIENMSLLPGNRVQITYKDSDVAVAAKRQFHRNIYEGSQIKVSLEST